MKKFVLCILACLSLAGCSSSPASPSSRAPSTLNIWMSENGKPKVLSTTAIIDDLVGEIGHDRVDHLALITGEIDPHSYELVKGDDEKLSRAQLVFCNGLGLEHGASLKYRLLEHPGTVALGDEIEKKQPDKILIIGGQKDPHVWMDVSLWAEAVGPIVSALSSIDPSGTDEYQKRGEELQKKMLVADQEILVRMQAVPSEKRYLVTSHDAFNYFTRRYLAENDEKKGLAWKERFAAPEGLAPDGQLSTADIQKIIDFLCLRSIGVVFPESNVSKDSLKKIVNACRQKGVEVKISQEMLYGDAIGSKESGNDTYLKIMQHNSNVISKEWK